MGKGLIYIQRVRKNRKSFQVKLGKYDYDAKFLFSELGYNFEPSEIGASFGNVQLKKLSHNLKIKISIKRHIKLFQ